MNADDSAAAKTFATTAQTQESIPNYARNYRPPSRVQVDRRKLQNAMQQQADSDQKNRHKEKLIDLAIGEHMNNDAMEVMRQ